MTIKEVSEVYGISADTLRYYERIGMIPEVTRTARRNQRLSGIRHWLGRACNLYEKSRTSVEALIE